MASKRPPRLTEAFIRSIKEPGKHGDGHGGHGLTLVVRDRAGGGLRFIWRQSFTIAGKKRSTGLGSHPVITLKMARDIAFDNARRTALGEDILTPPPPKPPVPSLGDAFDLFNANKTAEAMRKSERLAKNTKRAWNNSKEYCKPILAKSLSDVTRDDVLDILRPIWIPHRATGSRVQNHLNQILLFAIDREYRTTNPANRKSVTLSLGKQPPPVHHPAAPYTELGDYLAKIRDSDYRWAAKYSLLLLAFTEDRNGEVTQAVWSDVDWEKETLTIPVNRMKSGIEHVIPLPTQAMEILRFAWSKPHHSKGTIFPPKKGGRSLDNDALAQIPREMGMPFVPHGLRSSFKDWVTEKHPECRELAEISLAHVVGNATERAYRRTILLPQRRELLQAYADFLTETMGPVISSKDQNPDQDTDDMAGLEKAVINAVPDSDQQAGKPENGTTATTPGRTTKRRHPAQALATVNGRPPKGPKQRTKAFHQPGLQFVETRP